MYSVSILLLAILYDGPILVPTLHAAPRSFLLGFFAASADNWTSLPVSGY